MTDAIRHAMRDAMRDGKGNSLSPEPCALSPAVVPPSIDLSVGVETPRPATASAVDQPATMDGPSVSTHVHAFVPAAVGADGRERHEPPHPQRFRNRCRCGVWQTLVNGPACGRCGNPTVLGLADPGEPIHPCCAEPELMALGDAADRRNR